MRWSAALIALALPSLALAEGPSATAVQRRAAMRIANAPPGAARHPLRTARHRERPSATGSRPTSPAATTTPPPRSLTPTLDGQPLACDASSKTLTEGEEGEVSLECRFSIAQGALATQSLRVLLAWHHAQYMSFELRPE